MPFTPAGTFYPEGPDLHPSAEWWRQLAITGDATAKSFADAVNRTKGTLPDGTDLNTLSATTDNGGYGLSSSSAYINSPFAGAGVLTVEITAAGPGFQEAVQYATTNVWRRSLTNPFATPKVWGAWEQMSPNPYRGVAPDGALSTLSSVTNNGIWALSTSGVYSDAPFTGAGQVRVEVTGSGPGFQEAVQYATTNTWRRAITNPFVNPKTWGPWSPIGSSGTAQGDSDPGAPLESTTATLTMWGDSLTAAGGVATRLGVLTGATVQNRGVSGQSASQIASRQGGIPSLMTVTSDTIPASGPVAITARTVSVLSETGLPARSITGWLAGVHGTLSNTAGTMNYTFTRDGSGAATPCPAGTPFITDHGRDARRTTQIIWAGRNNPETGVVNEDLAMARHLSPALKKFIVVSATTASDETNGTPKHTLITGINTQLAWQFGDRYVDLRRWLIDNGLAAVGIAPTAADTTAIAGDTIPPSLTSDGVHFTSAAQTAIGTYLHTRLVALGWYS